MSKNGSERESNNFQTTFVKSKFKIEIRGGTVTSKLNDRVIILGTDGIVYRIDLRAQKDLASVPLADGEPVWIYCVPARFKVVTIIKQSDQCDRPDDIDSVVELE